jgi:NADH dehydrogenase/NADH:ubiquinone oxidoreductase subunit G
MRLLVLSFLSLAAAAGVVVGCSILEPNTDESRASQPRTEAETDEAAEQRHGMALLRDLLEKQTQVDGSLWVIDESDGLEKLVDDIAAASTRSLDALRASFSDAEQFENATSDLPAVEQRVREAIEAETARKLVLPGGPDARTLVLKQLRALEYGSVLAEVLADEEQDADRRKVYEDLQASYADLLERMRGFVELGDGE